MRWNVSRPCDLKFVRGRNQFIAAGLDLHDLERLFHRSLFLLWSAFPEPSECRAQLTHWASGSGNIIMPTSEDYARNAEDCREAAKRTHDETERAILMKLTEQWLRLAVYKKRKEAE
jgi:hypothetical protein